MEDALRDNAVEIKYNSIENETTERIKDDAILEVMGYPSDRLLSVSATRYKNSNEKGEFPRFWFTFLGGSDEKEHEKIAFVIDGERVELEAKSGYHSLSDDKSWKMDVLIKGWYLFTDPESGKGIGGRYSYARYLEKRGFDRLNFRLIGTVLSSELVKIIAEAKSVSMAVDSGELIDVNGGVKSFENTRFEIEGIQGFMKRVYHFFFDDTCYTEYCLSYYERKTKTDESNEKLYEQVNKKQKEKEQKKYEETIKHRNVLLVVLALSILFLILGISLEWGAFWSLLLPIIAGGYSVYKLGIMYNLW